MAGSTAYVGSGPALMVVDVSTPVSPQLLGEITLSDIRVREWRWWGTTLPGGRLPPVCG